MLVDTPGMSSQVANFPLPPTLQRHREAAAACSSRLGHEHTGLEKAAALHAKREVVVALTADIAE